jgi:hypothetical protein
MYHWSFHMSTSISCDVLARPWFWYYYACCQNSLAYRPYTFDFYLFGKITNQDQVPFSTYIQIKVCTSDPTSCELWSSEGLTQVKQQMLMWDETKRTFLTKKKVHVNNSWDTAEFFKWIIFSLNDSMNENTVTYLTGQYTMTYSVCLWQNWWWYKNYSLQKILGMFLPREILYIIEESSVTKAHNHLLFQLVG